MIIFFRVLGDPKGQPIPRCGRNKMKNMFSIRVTREEFLKLPVNIRRRAMKRMADNMNPKQQHGVDCPVARHSNYSGYLHAVGYFGPYDDDGISYCGRCHKAL